MSANNTETNTQQPQQQTVQNGENAKPQQVEQHQQTYRPKEPFQITLVEDESKGTFELNDLIKLLEDAKVSLTKIPYKQGSRISLPCATIDDLKKAWTAIQANSELMERMKRDYKSSNRLNLNEHNSVYIKKLPLGVQIEDLVSAFSQVGFVLSCETLRDQPSAFLSFAEDVAQLAVNAYNGKPLDEHKPAFSQQPLSVELYRTSVKEHHKAQSAGRPKTNLYVSGLPYNFDEKKVRALFKECGEIRSVRIKKPLAQLEDQQRMMAENNMTLLSAIAYVDFQKQEEAERAIKAHDGTQFSMHTLRVTFYQKQEPVAAVQSRIPNEDVAYGNFYKILFVSRLNKNVKKEDLMQACKAFDVEPSKIEMKGRMVENVFRSSGSAIISFVEKEHAAKAMEKLYYNEKLGMNLSIDFYKHHDTRAVQQDRLRNPLQNGIQQLTQITNFALMNNNNNTAGGAGAAGAGGYGNQMNQGGRPQHYRRGGYNNNHGHHGHYGNRNNQHYQQNQNQN